MSAERPGADGERVHTQALAAAIRSGDRSELQRLMALYRPRLRAAAEQLIPHPLRVRLDASDLVQDALLQGTAQIEQFQGTTDTEFAAWLKRILQRLIVDRIRHHTSDKRDIRRELPSPDGVDRSDSETPSRVASRKEDLSRIRRALIRLPPDQQQAIELRTQGASFEELGVQTGRSADAARMLWGRAISRLLKLVSRDDE